MIWMSDWIWCVAGIMFLFRNVFDFKKKRLGSKAYFFILSEVKPLAEIRSNISEILMCPAERRDIFNTIIPDSAGKDALVYKRNKYHTK